jgi:hypothetical protein
MSLLRSAMNISGEIFIALRSNWIAIAAIWLCDLCGDCFGSKDRCLAMTAQ